MKLPFTPLGIGLMGVIVILVFIGGPIATIWGLNTLFPSLAIPYTIETWLAAFIVPAAFKANVTLNNKKD
jgi:hypothetical protein